MMATFHFLDGAPWQEVEPHKKAAKNVLYIMHCAFKCLAVVSKKAQISTRP